MHYELDAPLAVSVVTYLDCEHYQNLHKSLSKEVEILNIGNNFFEHREVMKVFGFNFGQIYKVEYLPPGTFRQFDFRPIDKLNIFSFIKLETILNYNQSIRDTTLSELIVNLELPIWLYPFRKPLRYILKRVKIIKDLEDLVVIERRARLFGRNNINAYFKKDQFFLFKDTFSNHFGPNSEFYGAKLETKWPNIKEYELH